ncbi:baseplate J/gp47 family protein [Vibrio sp. PP-XX7]
MRGMNAGNGKPLEGMAHLKQSVRDILSTPIGSRPMRRDYGSRLFELIDSPANSENIAAMIAATAEALMTWEDRISVNKISVESASPSVVTLSVEGVYKPDGQPITLEGDRNTMSQQDLSQLSAPDLLETLDYQTIFAQMRDRLIENDPTFTAMTESDPVYKILEVAAYFRLMDRQRVNEAAQAVLLAYASGPDLDQIGARFSVQRKTITVANDSAVPPTDAVMESDDNFRSRIQLALEGMSVAGPVNAYKSHASSAHDQVKDVSAISPSAGEVLVTVLSFDNDGVADSAVLTAVETALNAEDVRPLTDQVTVQAAKIVNYQIDATLYIDVEPESESMLAAAKTSVQNYVLNQFKLGRNIRRSKIIAALGVSGVQNVVLTTPAADILISDEQAGFCTAVTVTYGGADES